MAHPREGWQGHGAPRKLTRRSFLGTTGGGARGPRRRPPAQRLRLRPGRHRHRPAPAPEQPGQMARFPRKHRHRPEPGPRTRRHPADLHLGRLHQPGLCRRLRQEVQGQGAGHHVQHHGRGDVQAAQRAQLRPADRRYRRRARPAHRVQAGPAAQPLLYPEHHPGLARLHQPVLRPGLAVHGAVHDLYDRDLLAQGPGGREPVHDGQPVGHAVAGQVQGPGRHPGRLPGVDQPGPDEERHLQPQHHRLQPDRHRAQGARGAQQPGQRPNRQQRLHRSPRR